MLTNATPTRVKIPNGWTPREYQRPFWDAMTSGGVKRAVAVWHRRGGKDSCSLNFTVRQAHIRTGVYWHMLPTQRQARKVVWNGIDREGRKVIDQVFPPAIRSGQDSTEMRIDLKCGSIWQLCGSDNYDSLVGSNPVGVVFSEFSLTNPAAWDYVRPILAENGGWAVFIFTPRGRNHAYRLFEQNKGRDGWFVQLLTVKDTNSISEAALKEELDSGMDEDTYRQEFLCDWQAAIKGAYYGKLLNKADEEGRVCRVPHDPAATVVTAWDLGIGDATAIWFAQVVGKEVHIIDYYAASGVGLDHYAKVLRERPYVYREHLLPHDAEASELGTGRRRVDVLRDLLGNNLRVLPRTSLDDGIQAVRLLLPRCWFDEAKCSAGLDALRQYQREWDDKRQDFMPRPLHDWTCHAADSFRYLACGLQDEAKAEHNYHTPVGGWMGV